MNNREIAALVWLVALAGWSLRQKEMRSSIGSLAKIAWGRLTVLFALWIGWACLEVAVLWRFGVWEADHVEDAIIWFLTSGLVLFGAFNEVQKSDRFLRRRVVKALEISVFLEALVNLYVFPLIIELLIVPISVVVVGVSIVAERDAAHATVKRLADWVMVAFGTVAVTFVVIHLVRDWRDLEAADLAMQVFLPIALTLGGLPFIYVVGVFAAYGQAFSRIDLNAESTPWHARLRAKLALVCTFHVRGRRLGRLTGPYQVELGRVPGFRAARAVIARGGAEIREREQRELAATDRLRRFAGVDGDDEHGRRLDRREFEETRAALRWLAVCMWGWYRRSTPGQYVPDLVERFSDDFTTNGLPAPAGVQLRVDRDGQAWMAWRRTITGWCFAIGGLGEPPNEWHYDGPEPPPSLPPGPGWYDDSKLPQAANWWTDDS